MAPAIRLRSGLGANRRPVNLRPFKKPTPTPRDLPGLFRYWSSDAPAELDANNRVTSATDLSTNAAVAYRTGQGRVGPEVVTVAGRKRWRFGGTAAPASLAMPIPTHTGYYTWLVVLSTAAQGQVIAPIGGGSTAQILVEEATAKRWNGFAGSSIFTAQQSGEHLVAIGHDNATGVTRLLSGTTLVSGTLSKRSLVGEAWLGRHGSNVRELESDLAAVALIDHWPTDTEFEQIIRPWVLNGAGSNQPAAAGGFGTGPFGTSPFGGGSNSQDTGAFGTGPFGTTPFGGTTNG